MTKKGTIFYIHGNSSSSRVFQQLMHSKKIRYAQMAPDLPGHGKLASNNRFPDFSTKGYCDFLLAKISEIDDDIVLAGNSLGGHIALEMAQKIERLRGLLIFGTPPVKKPVNISEAFLPVPALQTFLTENPGMAEVTEAFSQILFGRKPVDGFVADFKRANPKVRSALAKDLGAGNWTDQEKVFVELKVPKFIIAGSHDVSVNPDYLKRVRDQCNGSCELIFFDQCGHYPSLEKPVDFERAIQYIAQKSFM